MRCSPRWGCPGGNPNDRLWWGVGRRPCPLRPSKSAQADSEPRPTLPAPMRPVGTPPSGPSGVGALRTFEYTPRLLARLWAGGLGSEWAAPSSAAERGASPDEQESLRTLARLASGPDMQCRALDGEDCRAPLVAQRPKGRVTQPPSQTEQRREAGPQGRPPTAERTSPPARSLARLSTTTVNASQAAKIRKRGNVRNGTSADIRSRARSVACGSCEPRRSQLK
jgi:hypothetical protein